MDGRRSIAPWVAAAGIVLAIAIAALWLGLGRPAEVRAPQLPGPLPRQSPPPPPVLPAPRTPPPVVPPVVQPPPRLSGVSGREIEALVAARYRDFPGFAGSAPRVEVEGERVRLTDEIDRDQLKARVGLESFPPTPWSKEGRAMLAFEGLIEADLDRPRIRVDRVTLGGVRLSTADLQRLLGGNAGELLVDALAAEPEK